MKKILIYPILLAVVLGGGWYWHQHRSVEVSTNTKLKVGNFSGKLEEVNVGCFVDGECYVVVDGKHVTTTLGWRQEVVGKVEGVEGFGDLEQHIGENMEVYAQDKGDGTYTLYGSEGFYVKLK